MNSERRNDALPPLARTIWSRCVDRRWRWLFVTALFVGSTLALWIWTAGNERFAEDFDWLAVAHQRELQVYYHTWCGIPGLERSKIGKNIFCRRSVLVLIPDLEQLEAVLDMPQCPMNVEIRLNFNPPKASVDRLIERFGKDAIR